MSSSTTEINQQFSALIKKDQRFTDAKFLSGGFSGHAVYEVTDTSSNSKVILKQGEPVNHLHAVLVSQFLKQVTPNIQVKLNGNSYQFDTPQVTTIQMVDESIVQKQTAANSLDKRIADKKIQGLASLDSLTQAAMLGAIFQFLNLGDNIAHNCGVSNDNFVVFDCENALFLGGDCITSTQGIFNDKVVQTGASFNNHLFDLLALRNTEDKYSYINFEDALIPTLGDSDTWMSFFEGVKQGLDYIESNISVDFIENQWGADLTIDPEYTQYVKNVYKKRLNNIGNINDYINELIDGDRKLPGISMECSIVATLEKHHNVTAFLANLQSTLASEIHQANLSPIQIDDFYPQEYLAGPSKGDKPGRLFNFSQQIKREGLNFTTSINELATAFARLTATAITDEGIEHPCACNGPHHGLLVANFSYIVASEMLEDKEMKGKIDARISAMGPEVNAFFTENNYANYKKLVEIMALLHDSGRPTDGIDQWDPSNEQNVITNVTLLLDTTSLSEAAKRAIIKEVREGIENKDNLDLIDDTGFLLGAAVGAGDSLHSGHAYHGGVWDERSYDPKYVRLFSQYPSFQQKFQCIANEVRHFVPIPKTNYLQAVDAYLVSCKNGVEGECIIKHDFANIIQQQLNAIDPESSPIMAKHLASKSLLPALISRMSLHGIHVDLDFVRSEPAVQTWLCNLDKEILTLTDEQNKAPLVTKANKILGWQQGIEQEVNKLKKTDMGSEGNNQVKNEFVSACAEHKSKFFQKNVLQQAEGFQVYRNKYVDSLNNADKKIRGNDSWAPFAKNILLAISVVGLPAAMLSFTVKAFTGRYGFFDKTDKKLDSIYEHCADESQTMTLG